jgi:hypothetical protein
MVNTALGAEEAVSRCLLLMALIAPKPEKNT